MWQCRCSCYTVGVHHLLPFTCYSHSITFACRLVSVCMYACMCSAVHHLHSVFISQMQ